MSLESNTKISMKARGNALGNTEKQLEILGNGIFQSGKLPTFVSKLKELNDFPLRSSQVEIFQMNIGYMCNQVCAHCHVDAGPDRKEIMTRETMEQCLDVLRNNPFTTVDITGGAPEMNPHFRWFIEQLSEIGIKDIIVRCNLTIILANAKYNDLPEFFKKHKVHVVSSLPFYSKKRTDSQRGDGVFDKSIKALQMLNEIGYGMEGSGLQLDLVYNPSGAFLPADQVQLQSDYKKELKKLFNIDFNQLFTITNIPISRYLDYLVASGNYEEYMEKLVTAFNPSAVKGVMCRNTISVDWQGYLFDCDFNQMLGLPLSETAPQHVSEWESNAINSRTIAVNQHCYGCTAGAGSSCQGSLV